MSVNFTPEQKNYKDYGTFEPFKMFVLQNFPFIAEDFDAMTYYQMLCKVVEYLKDTIDNNKMIQENQNEVLNAYNQLQSYVNNYFNNLDVQDEINRKLDNMVKNGELQKFLNNLYNDLYNNVNQKISVQDKEIELINNSVQNINEKVNSAVNNNPNIANSVEEMTDTSKLYVNTSDGNWYYYTGTEWAIGGIYQANGIGNDSLSSKNLKSTLKNANKIRIPEYEELSGYRSGGGQVISLESFVYSSPILLKPFEKIMLKAKGYLTNVSMITRVRITDSEPVKVESLSIDSELHDYEYMNKSNEDEYVSISYLINSIEDVFIESSNLKVKKEITSFSNLINNECNNCLIVKSTKSIVNNADNLYKKVLHLDVTASPVTYGFSYYYFKNIPTTEMKDVKNIVAFIDIKGQAPSNENLMFRLGTQQSGLFNGFGLIQKKIVPTTEKYTRYFIEIDGITQDLTELPNLTIGICNMLDNNEDLSYDIRAMGLLLNSTIEEATNDFLTLKDKNELYIASYEKEIEKDLFASFIKFGVIGDSLASGESVTTVDGVTRYIDNYDYSWGQFMARKHGMTCVNFSSGGMTTRSWLEAYLSKLQKEENKCNAYIIGLGVNDKGTLGNEYIGVVSDINVNDSSKNSDTFYGNYGKIISKIKEVQAKAKIFLFTIPSQYTTQDYTSYNDAIKTIATLFNNVYVIDLANEYPEYFNSGFIYNNMRTGHYNAIGYKYMSDLLFKILSDYMDNNSGEFKRIEFIGTDYE